MDIPPRCSTLFMVGVENQLIRLVVLAMIERIERRANEHSSALARHTAIIMKSLINLPVEVVILCSTLRIDYAQKDVPKAEIRAKLCRNTRVMSENCDHRVLLFTL